MGEVSPHKQETVRLYLVSSEGRYMYIAPRLIYRADIQAMQWSSVYTYNWLIFAIITMDKY